MSAHLDAEVEKAVKSILALTAIAETNFPANENITITATGKNSATVTLPAYLLAASLKTVR